MVSPKVVVTGIGLMTALGSSARINWQKLTAGESAIALRQPFLALPPMPLAMMGKRPLPMNEIVRSVVQEAWTDAGLELGKDGADLVGGVVIGSSRSHLREWEAMAVQQRQGSFKGDWLAALPHTPALMAARMIGSTGPVLAPMAACATGVWAIAQAVDLIRSGQCERVVAGAVESPITPLTLAGFRKMGALAKTGCYPFDCDRDGFVLGEGGAVVVLESAALANKRNACVYGEVLGVGITNDSHHVSAFDPTYRMGKRAVTTCLQRSGLNPDDVDAVHTHGTSTAQNDRMEAALIEQILGSHPLIMATKGSTGHTLGASGAVVVALSLMSLKRQQSLPCVGLRRPDFELNFSQVAKAQPLSNILCFSFGFGGQNAVLALASRSRARAVLQ
ncbi:MAG: beta-ketoacyl-ACP synthase [Phormidesmis sp.]